MDQEAIEKLALTFTPGLGKKTTKHLLSIFGNVEAFWRQSKNDLLKIPGISSELMHNILNKVGFDKAEKQYLSMEKNKIKYLFYLDKNYPWRLNQIPDSPIVLYYKGMDDLDITRALAIVGTRNATSLGKKKVEEIVEQLSGLKIGVISGLAYGIDITAHRACIQHHVFNVAVLGSSLDQIYPAQHSKYVEKIIENGALVSEFPCTTGPEFHHFPQRNRIIAALADALLIVESAEQGGSMITADLAIQYHKDVFAIPGRTTDPYSKGCHKLIKENKAALVEDFYDICKAMLWEDNPKKYIQQSLFMDLDDEEREILGLLDKEEAVHIDKIYQSLHFSPSKIASLMLSLEFKGAIINLPGKRYLLAI